LTNIFNKDIIFLNIFIRDKNNLRRNKGKPKEILLRENEVTTITIENEAKKGQIKVIKRDKDNKQIKLQGVKFEIRDEENNIIQTLITNENGEAITDKLKISKKYRIKEIETKREYVLDQNEITVELKENEIKELIIENEKKKGQIQVIKVDSENNEVFIPDVTFEIYDSKNNLVDTIITDENGKAVSKRLPIDEEYTIKETISNKAYTLTEEPQKVVLEENKITNVTIQNTKKYGKLTINKISNQSRKILKLPENSPIPNTKFLIINEKGEKVGIYVTNEKGKILIEKLPYGEYTVYEYEVPEHFLKDANPQTIK